MKIPFFDRWWLTKTAGVADYKEVNRLLIKAGRRAAYDLLHAADSLWRQGKIDISEYYRNRANMWLGIFNPLDDGIHYRDQLHMEISQLKNTVDRYRQYIKDNNLKYPDFDSIGEDPPF